MTTTATHTNGLLSPNPVDNAISTSASSARIIMPDKVSRILCIADIRGDYHELNRLIREHNATAVIHTGDFGFLTEDSLERMGDKILRHLLQYSPLIPPATRTQLLAIPLNAGRQALIAALKDSSVHFPLSQFPHLLSGAITFPVPVFTVWGLIEDVRVAEKFRTGEYEVRNLSVIDEATSRLLEVGGLKLRLFGLGGAVAMHKLFDHGDGHGTISGGQGTMWLTALQIGELVDTAQRVADPTETRLFIASAPISRWGLLEQTALAINADLTISGGLHFRYPASYNEYSVHGDYEQYRQKLIQSRDAFSEVYKAVKEKIDASMSESQLALLKKAVQTCQFVPFNEGEDNWTSTWHWVLSDASCGHMLLSISEGRVSAETKSNGLHFGHRNSAQPSYPSNNTSAARNSQAPAAPAAMSKPNASMGRPGAPSASAGIPAKPAASATPAAQPNGGKGVPAKPQQAPTAPRAAAPPSTSTANAGSSIPAKPPAQPSRQPRGPTSGAYESGPNGSKTDAKPAQASSKPTTAPNGLPKAPTPAGSRSSPAPGQKGERSNGKDSDKKDDSANETARSGRKAEGAADKHGDEQSSPTGPLQARPHEKRSLYLKKLPIPTSEEEIRSLFPALKDKITFVKMPYDQIKKQQKEFAYVDFQTEADAQEALKNHEEKIRDTAIVVVISNPPARNASIDFGARGGRGGGSRGSGLRGRGGSRFPSTSGAPQRSDSATGGGDKPSAPPAEKKESAPAAAPAAKKD